MEPEPPPICPRCAGDLNVIDAGSLANPWQKIAQCPRPMCGWIKFYTDRPT